MHNHTHILNNSSNLGSEDTGSTLSDSIQSYLLRLEAEGKSPRTLESYSRVLSKIQNITGKPIEKLEEEDIYRTWALLRRKGYSSSTRHLYGSVLKGFLKHIGRTDLADRVKSERVTWLPREPPNIEDMDRLGAACQTSEEKALLLVLYSTGLRLRELLGDEKKGTDPVYVEEIDWTNRRIRLKGGKGRGRQGEDYVYFMLLDQNTIKAIEQYTQGRLGPLFQFSPRRAQKIIKTLGERCGIKLTPHLLRHASATHLLRMGVGIAHVSKHLRHRSLETTQCYTQITGEDMEAVREALKKTLALKAMS